MSSVVGSGRGAVTRRRLLQTGGGLAVAGIGAGALKLPFFDAPGAQQDPASCVAGDVSSSDSSLIISNWTGYIDPRKKEKGTFQQFEDSRQITVSYTDDVNDNAEFYAKVRNQLRDWEEAGYGDLPVCMAKTQYSFSTDPSLRGAPTGHSVPVREVRLSAGAGFIVVVCGDIMTMPGLPRNPAALSIGLNAEGDVEGLF